MFCNDDVKYEGHGFIYKYPSPKQNYIPVQDCTNLT